MIKSSNQIELFTQDYLVKNNIANVLIIHGLHEHCGRYEHVAKRLNALDINVYTFDLRGHGKSGGSKNIVKDLDEYRQDVENVYRSIPKDKPFFMMGISMGGLILIQFLLFQERNDVSGVILLGAALEVGKDISPMTVKVVQFLGKYLPNLKSTKLEPTSVSRDSDEVKNYETDPLVTLDGVKAGMGLALIEAINDVKSRFEEFDYPVVVMHGSDDKITNPEGSEYFFSKIKSTDKTLKIWPDAYHALMHETNKSEIMEFLNEWVSQKINR